MAEQCKSQRLSLHNAFLEAYKYFTEINLRLGRPGKFLGRCPVKSGTETKGDEIPYSNRSLCVSRSYCTHHK